MATLAKAQPTGEPFYHRYHATAGILDAQFELPIQKELRSPHASLPPDGGYEFKTVEPFHLGGLLSYESGYAQVAGFRSENGFTTLATSVVEGLNILDVITADRVVGQITTEHPPYSEGQVPSVSFLGAHFDNLRIDGERVEVTRCTDILSPKPAGDKSYLEDEVVLWKIGEQQKVLPAWAREHQGSAVQDISQSGESTARCSLVSRVETPSGNAFGHVIHLPCFGNIFLAELRVTRKKPRSDLSQIEPGQNETYSFHLEMIRAELSCMTRGKIHVSPCDANGTGSGGGGGHFPPP